MPPGWRNCLFKSAKEHFGNETGIRFRCSRILKNSSITISFKFLGVWSRARFAVWLSLPCDHPLRWYRGGAICVLDEHFCKRPWTLQTEETAQRFFLSCWSARKSKKMGLKEVYTSFSPIFLRHNLYQSWIHAFLKCW